MVVWDRDQSVGSPCDIRVLVSEEPKDGNMVSSMWKREFSGYSDSSNDVQLDPPHRQLSERSGLPSGIITGG